MNIPNLPSDNLYKFKAITGFIIFISTAIFGFLSFQQLEIKITQEETNVVIKEQRLKYFEDELKRVKNELNKIESKDTPPTESDIKLLINDQNIINEQEKLLKDDSYELMKSKKLVDSYKNESIKILIVCLMFLFFGWKLNKIGEDRWYDRLQKYEDIIIKGKAKEYSMKIKISK